MAFTLHRMTPLSRDEMPDRGYGTPLRCFAVGGRDEVGVRRLGFRLRQFLSDLRDGVLWGRPYAFG